MVPTLVDVGGLRIGTHDAFTVLALAIGLGLYHRELRRRGLLEDRIVWISLAVVLGGAIGARLIMAWDHLDYYAQAIGRMPLTWVIEHSGKSIIGAVAGGYLAGVIAKRALGYTRSTGDAYALAIAVATGVGRVGCFLSELPLGTPTTLPWGVTVSPEAAAAFPVCPGCDGPMHPSHVYEIAFNILAALAIVRFGRRIPAQGDLLKVYLLAAVAFRFLVEFVRANPTGAFGLTSPQLVLVPLGGLLVAHFFRQARRGAWSIPPAPPADQRGHARAPGAPVYQEGT
jgi:phosphatidylglycerol:prolipoprotein diacylglycerol transferase